MAAPKGNDFWTCRAKHGPNFLYEGEEGAAELLDEGIRYLEWCRDNPLKEQKAFAYKGEVVKEDVEKMRVATIGGFCLFLGINPTTWQGWRGREDLSSVITTIENAIREYKFSGAAADLLNANIISRDLGLADRQEISGPGGAPIQKVTKEMDAKEAAEAYAATREAGRSES